MPPCKREALRKVEARVAAEAGKPSNVVSIRKHGENTENQGSGAVEGSAKLLERYGAPGAIRTRDL